MAGNIGGPLALVDVASVSAVSATAAQPAVAASPATIDAVFGALLQEVSDIAPQPSVPVTPQLPLIPNLPAPANNDGTAQDAIVAALATPAPSVPVSGQPTLPPVPTPDLSSDPEPGKDQTPTPDPQQVCDQQPTPPVPGQPAPPQNVQQPGQTASPPAAPSDDIIDDANKGDAVANPVPQPAPVPTKPVARDPASKSKPATEAASSTTDDDTTPSSNETDATYNVLAGFLMAQIEPAVVPANDQAPQTEIAPVTDGTAAPVPPTPAQTPATPNATAAPAAPPPPASKDGQAAAVAAQPAATEAEQAQTDDDPPPVRKDAGAKPAPDQHQAAAASPADVKPAPAADAPVKQPEARPDSAEPRAAANVEAPAPANTNTPAQTAPAPHQAAAAAASMAAPPPVASSGLRKLTAGLQIAAQEQDATATIDKVAVTIATRAIDGLRHFDIRLDPPELGRVDVRLSVDDTGKAQASLVVDKPQTLELLQRDAPNLNRALNDAGLDLSNNGLNFSLREQDRQNDGGMDQGRSRQLSVKAVVQTDAAQIHSSLGSYAPNSVRLDIRV